eukprot:TRINITY_DN273_c0_g1_i1.p1 TRINITY_DN273_c0_g1~~TRINITY_DN273_c0_g1_i1.p1  ORF type:complete len:808 (-),score=166.77 TRINITY_DN273_c0_g1_i1:1054-3477(-)
MTPSVAPAMSSPVLKQDHDSADKVVADSSAANGSRDDIPVLAPISTDRLSDLCNLGSSSPIKKGHESNVLTDLYTLGPKLGEGFSGVVRLAEDLDSGRLFACKSVMLNNTQRPTFREELKAEIRAMEKVRGHAHVMELRGVFEEKDCVHMILDLCTGGDLFDYLTENRWLKEKDIAKMFWQAASALHHCHSHGVVHRDVKPENMLVASTVKDEDGRRRPILKLADFGLAVRLQSGQKAVGLAGSPAYVAPEIIKGKPYGFEVDMWSLGVALYVALSGFMPFWGRNNEEIMAAICRKGPDYTQKPWPTISPEARDLVRSLMHSDPKKRFSAKQALQHVWIVTHVPSHFAPSSPLRSLSTNNAMSPGRCPSSPRNGYATPPLSPTGFSFTCAHCGSPALSPQNSGTFPMMEGLHSPSPSSPTSPVAQVPLRPQRTTTPPSQAANFWISQDKNASPPKQHRPGCASDLQATSTSKGGVGVAAAAVRGARGSIAKRLNLVNPITSLPMFSRRRKQPAATNAALEAAIPSTDADDGEAGEDDPFVDSLADAAEGLPKLRVGRKESSELHPTSDVDFQPSVRTSSSSSSSKQLTPSNSSNRLTPSTSSKQLRSSSSSKQLTSSSSSRQLTPSKSGKQLLPTSSSSKQLTPSNSGKQLLPTSSSSKQLTPSNSGKQLLPTSSSTKQLTPSNSAKQLSSSGSGMQLSKSSSSKQLLSSSSSKRLASSNSGKQLTLSNSTKQLHQLVLPGPLSPQGRVALPAMLAAQSCSGSSDGESSLMRTPPRTPKMEVPDGDDEDVSFDKLGSFAFTSPAEAF